MENTTRIYNDMYYVRTGRLVWGGTHQKRGGAWQSLAPEGTRPAAPLFRPTKLAIPFTPVSPDQIINPFHPCYTRPNYPPFHPNRPSVPFTHGMPDQTSGPAATLYHQTKASAPPTLPPRGLVHPPLPSYSVDKSRVLIT